VSVVAVEVMLDSNIEKQPNMRVGDPIEHFPTLLAGLHQTRQAKLTKLMAGRRLAELDQTSEITHTQLPSLQKGVDNPQPARIRKKLEPLSQQLSIIQAQNIVGERAMSMALFG
jgi:hypothetical protein